ncbi:MAG: shikimate dehydrogenase [Candidatus Pelagibacter sp.]|nr:shikimate dehydrogenase [Candidatus Pelagibacter sp.]OUV98204.1 MAG: shikimate dehydrogenase [Candidatus Pelagibacter sp. TMED142]|tara:strand:- start:274 stop:1056 length:783 start_codon:yes stop_codon:yes gene_type:complete
MKKLIVIGNPISHSLSPKLHNYWIQKEKIKAIYDKKLLEKEELEENILEIKKGNIFGMNVTIPFKKLVIPLLDGLTSNAQITQSVNTIYLDKNKVYGDNTDIFGFVTPLKDFGFVGDNKQALILGAGGVSASIIIALKNLGVSKINLMNRTKQNAIEIKNMFKDIEVKNWGEKVDFDIVVNCTSLGLNNEDIGIDFSDIKDKIFYDIIYKPKTKFLINAEKNNKIINGKMMFIYQAQKSFEIWHGILPTIDTDVVELIND